MDARVLDASRSEKKFQRRLPESLGETFNAPSYPRDVDTGRPPRTHRLRRANATSSGVIRNAGPAQVPYLSRWRSQQPKVSSSARVLRRSTIMFTASSAVHIQTMSVSGVKTRRRRRLLHSRRTSPHGRFARCCSGHGVLHQARMGEVKRHPTVRVLPHPRDGAGSRTGNDEQPFLCGCFVVVGADGLARGLRRSVRCGVPQCGSDAGASSPEAFWQLWTPIAVDLGEVGSPHCIRAHGWLLP